MQLNEISKKIANDNVIDGRRECTRLAREKVVAALLELVGGGNVAPTAAEVVEVARVGLRSVFRYFEDMDALYREMSEKIEAKVLPNVLEPAIGATWKERLVHIASKRAKVFEQILPFRISANLKRFSSEFLMEDYRRMLRLENAGIEAQLPEHILPNSTAAHCIKSVLSFQNWRLLRHDQGLSVAQASEVVRELLINVLKGIDD
ncbi:MAG: TetR family transcriptional regulator [Hyphomonadaceae bacterium]|nr:MAG: TetR family transcriptional regulator [Hyphomonadaceae bacterium]